MRLLITLGPAWEPLDGARRITNLSTGRLGVHLANAFVEAGWEVHCLRGEGATFSERLATPEVEVFSTNDHLVEMLERTSRRRRVDAVLHAAALCDFRVARVVNSAGDDVRSAKIATRDGRLWVELEPATKVLPRLRGWFPGARIVGWKYELAGTREEAFAKAWRQLHECRTDACVLNGAAYGDGFALCRPDAGVRCLASSTQLAEALTQWLASDLASASTGHRSGPVAPAEILEASGSR